MKKLKVEYYEKKKWDEFPWTYESKKEIKEDMKKNKIKKYVIKEA